MFNMQIYIYIYIYLVKKNGPIGTILAIGMPKLTIKVKNWPFPEEAGFIARAAICIVVGSIILPDESDMSIYSSKHFVQAIPPFKI
jgi:hypothetical protein